MLLATDSVILILLDLTTAFHTVNRTILLSRLECFVGIQGYPNLLSSETQQTSLKSLFAGLDEVKM